MPRDVCVFPHIDKLPRINWQLRAFKEHLLLYYRNWAQIHAKMLWLRFGSTICFTFYSVIFVQVTSNFWYFVCFFRKIEGSLKGFLSACLTLQSTLLSTFKAKLGAQCCSPGMVHTAYLQNIHRLDSANDYFRIKMRTSSRILLYC